ncbi:M56 family metallopeptidase [Tautonia plasticadhaerens]|uniref:Regulatory protein BlaR1 n=1 Tax=Tautonia plasticadhaerens TaxID=2527974 RepID=A0A518HDB7_9BACT|nr:M56 family metallopeptidase [Tautonia plasticadhaerens]QDV38849.1 Regulatory protein BlaR1 [Tautonia plasticadhaerens]
MTWQTISGGAVLASEFALNWLIQSTVLLAIGLAAGRLLRPAGAAVQSASYRATLAAVLASPLASAALLGAGIDGVRIRLAAAEPPEVAPVPPPPAVGSAPGETSGPVPVGGPRRPGPSSDAGTVARSPSARPEVGIEWRSLAGAADAAVSPEADAGPAGGGPRVAWSRADVGSIALPIGVVWLAGTLALLVRLLVGHRRLARLRGRASRVEPEVEELARGLARALGVALPGILRSPYLASPCLCGLRRPAILLPEGEDDPREAIVHELAHLARRDVSWNLLRQLAGALLWVHPLIWALSRRIEATAEEVCDDVVVALGADRSRYAGLLLEIAERSLPPASPVLVGVIASRSSLGRRVRRILDASRPLSTGVGARALAATAVLGLAGTLMAGLLGVGGSAMTAGAMPRPGAQADDDGEAGDPFKFNLTVVGPAGAPVPGVGLDVRTSPAPTADAISRGEFVRVGNYGILAKADDHGRFTVTLPGRPDRFSIGIHEPGYGPFSASWSASEHPREIPGEFVAELDEGWAVGGVVVDPEGEPIEGVEVHPSIEYKKRPGDTGQLAIGTRIRTDAEGRWRFESVPASMGDVFVSLDHPDYAPLRLSLPRDGFGVARGEAPDSRIELRRGLTVTGTVTDDSGEPIAGALVRTEFVNEIREARTDDRGVYRLEGCEPMMARVVVSAEGRAMDLKEVRVSPEMGPVDFSMRPGGTIRVRVVDEQGIGIPRARIMAQRWRGPVDYFEFDHVDEYTNDQGVWEWHEAPLDEIQADIYRPGGMSLSKRSLVAREEEYVFSPPRALVVSGRVVDAGTKEPIASFRVTPGLRNSDPRIRENWIPHERYEASDGEYRVRFSHDYPAHLVRIEADGYRVAVSRDILSDEGDVVVDFELEPAEDIAATILTADGGPASLAEVALGEAGSQINVTQGAIDDGSTYAIRLQADEGGRFRLPARDEPFQVVITHPAGFAHLKSEGGRIPDRVTLTRWARVEGTFRVGPEPAPNVVLWLNTEGIHSYGDGVPNIFTHHEATTGAGGRFAFERAFPGRGWIGRNILLTVDDGATEVTSSRMSPVELVAGEAERLDLGGTGRPVVGTLEAPAGRAEPVLWSFALVDVRLDLAVPPPPPEPPAAVRDDPGLHKEWWDSWRSSEEGKRWAAAREASDRHRMSSPYFMATVARDGSFRIDDVPEGDYVLSVRFNDHEAGRISGRPFSVPPDGRGGLDGPIDLGTLKLGP